MDTAYKYSMLCVKLVIQRLLNRVQGPMLGIRASPSGRYLLVLLRNAPSEIWLVSLPHIQNFVALERALVMAGLSMTSETIFSFQKQSKMP